MFSHRKFVLSGLLLCVAFLSSCDVSFQEVFTKRKAEVPNKPNVDPFEPQKKEGQVVQKNENLDLENKNPVEVEVIDEPEVEPSVDPKPTPAPQVRQQKIDILVKELYSYIGTKYHYSAMSRKGIDCSGLVYKCYEKIGVEIPRMSRDQARYGERVAKMNELEAGDIIYFTQTPGRTNVTHVGVVVENRGAVIKFIHASTKRGVTESNLLSNWYKPRYLGGRRII